MKSTREWMHPYFREALSDMVTEEVPTWARMHAEREGDGSGADRIQSWVVEHLKHEWTTGIGAIEAAESIVWTAISNGNIEVPEGDSTHSYQYPEWVHPRFREVLGRFVDEPVPTWARMNGEAKRYLLLQDWVSEHAQPAWSSGVGTIEAAELIVWAAIRAGSLNAST